MFLSPSTSARLAIPLPRLLVAVVVAALLGVALVPNVAFASCGDYVFIRDASGKLVRASSALPGHVSPCPGGVCHEATQQEAADEPVVPVKRPCNGPHCGSVPSAPLAPIPVPVSTGQVRDLVALASASSSQDDVHLLSRELRQSRQLLAEIHLPQDVFEPPR